MKSNISNDLDVPRKNLALFSANYEDFLILGDFHVQFNQTYMMAFCNSFSLKSFAKESNCFKNPENPSCIDLMLTNSPKSFQNSYAIKTGLSDFHKMILLLL